MPIKLQKTERARLVASVKRYCAENLEPVGDLQAGLLLDFFLVEAGPAVYNQAVAAATARILSHVTDLPGEVYEPEVDYWRKSRK